MARYIDIDPILAKLEEFARSTCDSSYEDGIKIAIQVINEAPAADAQEVKHAHWIELAIYKFACSYCNEIEHYESPYCRQCGAKMDGKDKRQ